MKVGFENIKENQVELSTYYVQDILGRFLINPVC